MATVADLIKQLQDEDPESPVIFQYLLPEHTSTDTETFEKIAERLEDTEFYSDLTNQMLSAIAEIEADLEDE